jgi:hypothetical protein
MSVYIKKRNGTSNNKVVSLMQLLGSATSSSPVLGRGMGYH